MTNDKQNKIHKINILSQPNKKFQPSNLQQSVFIICINFLIFHWLFTVKNQHKPHTIAFV